MFVNKENIKRENLEDALITHDFSKNILCERSLINVSNPKIHIFIQFFEYSFKRIQLIPEQRNTE